MPSDTPRTDAQILVGQSQGHAGYVHASFARVLEMELKEERARLRYLSELWMPTDSNADPIAKWIKVGDHNGMCRAIDDAFAREIAATKPDE